MRQDSYQMKPVPGLWPREETSYTDFWCFNSGRNDGKMVFVILRKPSGKKDAAMEFRSFDPTLLNPEDQISDLLFEVPVQPLAQRITVLRTDNSFNVNLDAKQLIVAHKYGADIFDVVYNNSPPHTDSPTLSPTISPTQSPDCGMIKKKKLCRVEPSCQWNKKRRKCKNN